MSDPAKEFLEDFLKRLMLADQTNKELVEVMSVSLQQQSQVLSQQNQIISHQSQILDQLMALNARLDGVAQRCDYLYKQIGRLADLLVDDSDTIPANGTSYQHQQTAGGLRGIPPPPTLGQVAGHLFDQVVHQRVHQRGSGRRRRR